jgi:acetyltransferase-like isoleucine patch superfamily enzyme
MTASGEQAGRRPGARPSPPELGHPLRSALATPWKAVNEIRRLAWLPLIRLYFAIHGVAWRPGWRIYGTPLIQRVRGSTIAIGDDLEMRSWFGSNPLGVRQRCILATWSPEARIEIGDGVGMTGVSVCARTRVSIGNRVAIGANCTITDTDFHPLEAVTRRLDFQAGASAAVVIEDDTFIGMHALILKGARIGAGAVVGAGSVVVGTVPPRVVVAGNPARVIRPLDGP